MNTDEGTQDIASTLWALGKPIAGNLENVDSICVNDVKQVPFRAVASTMYMLSKILYSDLRFSGVVDCSVMVTMVHQGRQYVIAGHGNVNLEILLVNDAICPCNSTCGNVMMIKDVQASDFTVAAQAGIHVYLGGRFTALPKISICYLAYQRITQPDVLKAMEDYMRDTFTQLDTLVDEFVHSIVKVSYLQDVVMKSSGMAFVDHANVKTNTFEIKYAINTEVLGFTEDQLIRDPTVLIQAIHPDDRDTFSETRRRGMEAMHSVNLKLRFVVNGQTKYVHIRASVKRISDVAYQFTGLALDVTDSHVLEEEKTLLQLKLDTLNERKRHEAELKRVEYEATKKAHLEHEEQMTHHFKNSFLAIEHVLKSSRAHDTEHPSVEQARALVQEGLHTCMRAKTLKLIQYGEYKPLLQWLILCELITTPYKCDFDAPTQLMVYTDEALVKIILQNMVSNAVSHGGKDGGVTGGITTAIKIIQDKLTISVTNLPGPDHADMLQTFGQNNAFESIAQRPREKAAANNSYSQGLGLVGIKQCADILEASVGLYFHADRVETKLTLKDKFKFATEKIFQPEKRPVIACLEDSRVQRKMLQRIFKITNASDASFVKGETMEEINTFPEKVMELGCVDYCIIDQNLDNPDPMCAGPAVLGTSVIDRLKSLGFTGKCVIRSANDSPECLKLYKRHGAAFMSKSTVSPEAFVESVKLLLM